MYNVYVLYTKKYSTEKEQVCERMIKNIFCEHHMNITQLYQIEQEQNLNKIQIKFFFTNVSAQYVYIIFLNFFICRIPDYSVQLVVKNIM